MQTCPCIAFMKCPMQGPAGGLGGAGSLSSDVEEPAMRAERQGAACGRRTSARRKGARPQRCVLLTGSYSVHDARRVAAPQVHTMPNVLTR